MSISNENAKAPPLSSASAFGKLGGAVGYQSVPFFVRSIFCV